MKNKSRLMPMLIAGTVLAAGAYALSRAATKVKQARVTSQHEVPLQSVAQLNRPARADLPPDPLTLDLTDLFDSREPEAAADRGPASVTAQVTERVPFPSSADDTEALAPEDIGQRWLAHATQSERSRSETASLDIEDIAAPSEEPDEAEAESVDYGGLHADFSRIKR